jgi:hypothetical protein
VEKLHSADAKDKVLKMISIRAALNGKLEPLVGDIDSDG